MTNGTVTPKPCQLCNERPAVTGERFCKICKPMYLKEMRLKHPNPERTGFSDQRGRKVGRTPGTLSGLADMREYDNEVEDDT